MEVFIAVRGLCKSFREGEQDIAVLRDLDLEMGEGERLAIVGESGAGKSTLLHILGTLDRPTAGLVIYRGRDLSALNTEELCRFRNREIGFVFQFHYLLPDFSALENVMLPALIGGWERPRAEERARELLEEVGLKHRWSHRPGKLSGGEQQRVAFARALISKPRLILADEPTGDLDPQSSAEIEEVFLRLNEREGVGLVVATHSWELASRIGRRLELRDGRFFT